MDILLYLLKLILVRTPQEILIALFKIIVLVLTFLFVILLRLWEFLLGLLKRKNLYPEDEQEPCGRLPEAIARRPDPAIYSQRLLRSQGLPVTWNNPDIWVARADNPTNIEPDSYHLVEDTDYIVSVRAHNASTDAAIGVRVRLNYRPWSFNSPDLVPIETDATGNEVFRFVNIMPMSYAVTQFHWHTPKLEPGQERKHFCLQASLYHPMDTNTANNMGQENTNVWRSDNPGFVRAGQEVTLDIPLFNLARKPQVFQFQALKYEINQEDKFELKLKTTHGYARRSVSQRLANFSPSLRYRQSPKVARSFSREGAAVASVKRRGGKRFTFENQPSLVAVKNKYIGFEEIRERIMSRDYSLPDGMTVKVDDQPLEEGTEIEAKESKVVRFAIKVPENVTPGTSIPLNLIAQSANGVLAGGVTLILNVEEEN